MRLWGSQLCTIAAAAHVTLAYYSSAHCCLLYTTYPKLVRVGEERVQLRRLPCHGYKHRNHPWKAVLINGSTSLETALLVDDLSEVVINPKNHQQHPPSTFIGPRPLSPSLEYHLPPGPPRQTCRSSLTSRLLSLSPAAAPEEGWRICLSILARPVVKYISNNLISTEPNSSCFLRRTVRTLHSLEKKSPRVSKPF